MLCVIDTDSSDNGFSYISEAAASLLDERLDLHIVPRTQLVSLSSPVGTVVQSGACGPERAYRPSFMTGWIGKQRRKANHYQRRLGACNTSSTDTLVLIFYSGPNMNIECFSDASDFLRKHPWPGRAISDTFDDSNHRKGVISKKFLTALKIVCGRTGEEEEMYDEDDMEDERVLFDATESRSGQPFYWTPALQDNFREELEK